MRALAARALSALAGSGLVVIAATRLHTVFDGTFTSTRLVIAATAAPALAVLVVRNPRLAQVTSVILGVGATALVAWKLGLGPISGPADAVAHGAPRTFATRWPTRPEPLLVETLAFALVICSTVAVALALVGRFAVALVAPGLCAVLVVGALGAPAGAPPVGWVAAWCVLAIVTLAAANMARRPAHQRSAPRRAVARSGLAGLLVFAVVATAVPVAASPILRGGDRYDPRDRPLDTRTVETVNPLDLVARRRDRAPAVVEFEITTSAVARWRRVALTTYDGRAWEPPAVLRSAGRELADIGDASTFEVTATVADLDGLWVPQPVADLVGISLPVRVDDELAAIVADTPLEAGDAVGYRLRPRAAQPAALRAAEARPVLDGVGLTPELLTIATRAVEGATSDYQRATALADMLRSEYVLDPSMPAGVAINQLEAFLTVTRRGTAEQFVAAYGLLAAGLGLPVRVAVGWTVGQGGAAREILSSDAASWPEVDFAGAGWLAIDAVPSDEVPASTSSPVPPVAPALPDVPPPDQSSTSLRTDRNDDDEERPNVVVRVGRSPRVVVPLGVLTLVAMYVTGLLILKRRHHPRRPQRAAVSVVNAYLRASDAIVDLGGTFDPTRTDHENATSWIAFRPTNAESLRNLAERATQAVYGPPSTSDDERAAWARWETFNSQLRTSVSRRRWLRSRLSIRSLRRVPGERRTRSNDEPQWTE